MSTGSQKQVPKSTTIYAPSELKLKVLELSEKTGKPQWKILLEALTLYETTLRKPRTKEELPIVDKVIWYVEKLSMSIGALKENPSEDNFQRTMKTVNQVKERLDVDVRLLERAVRDYVSAVHSSTVEHKLIDEVTIELNMALKSVLIEIVYKYILKEGEPQKPQNT